MGIASVYVEPLRFLLVGRFVARNAMFLMIGMLVYSAEASKCCAESQLEIEKRALAYRENITSGHISLQSCLIKVNGSKKSETRTFRDIYFHGDRVRCDLSTGSGNDLIYMRVNCLGCGSFDRLTWVSGSTGKRTEAQLIIKPAQMDVSSSDFIPRPAELGMIPLPLAMMRHLSMDAYLTRADREELSVESTELDGVDCFRISYTTPNATRVDEWISPDRGYSVIRIDERFQNQAGSEFHDSLISTVERHEPSGVWFPVFLEYLRTIDSAPFTTEEVQISIHSLNVDPAPDVFTLAGIKQLLPGTRVIQYAAQGEIVPDVKIKKGSENPVTRQSANRNIQAPVSASSSKT
ncbi:MAG: hypothetical protein R3C59_17340 [Planctomycetaceae bacterium]